MKVSRRTVACRYTLLHTEPKCMSRIVTHASSTYPPDSSVCTGSHLSLLADLPLLRSFAVEWYSVNANRMKKSQMAGAGIALTRVAGLRPVVAFLDHRGARVERLLQRVKISPDALRDAEALIPTSQGFRFMEESARVEGIENLGLLVGQETRLEQFGVYGSLIRRKRTLGEAIATVFQLLPFFSSGTQMWIEDRGDRAVFCQRFADGLGDHRQADQYSLMMMITLLRLAAGPTWHPDEVHLRMPRGARFDRFPPLASCVVRFEQPANAVVFPRSLLDRPLAATGLPVLKPEKLEAWTSSAPAPDFPGSLLQVAEALPPSGYPQIGAAAGAVGMSVRSLQRRLAESGVTFKGIMADERFAAAAKLLRGGYAKILDIALDLGYSDHAHFTRAFHRWAGTAPREFRRLARQPA